MPKAEPTSIVKLLKLQYGGDWKLNRTNGIYTCNDKQRYVVGTFNCDCEPDFCSHPVTYWLYGDGTPRLVTQLWPAAMDNDHAR